MISFPFFVCFVRGIFPFNDYEFHFYFHLNNMFHGYVNLLNIAFKIKTSDTILVILTDVMLLLLYYVDYLFVDYTR